ncbi:uncharacterized protein LOC114844131 isoform X2 [Betta splendens]|uniref:Uncharacterized protein LOC114844131 isoform X2 n=1 Tax=Betta splendens TaxID=158456 RepID=A0A9W2XFS5_BETSP|nr:uncharacterized protein LOC114844131 isoform X2 [Betta splendens]
MATLVFSLSLTCVFLGSLAQMKNLKSSIYVHQESVFHPANVGDNVTLQCSHEDAGHGKNHLTISDLHISDSGTYYCIGCYAYDFQFTEGLTISVKGSGSAVPALVHQAVSGSIQPGGSVTLNCTVQTGTCEGQHSVYWFKDAGEAHPGIIYTHGDRNDQCEKKPDTETHTCVYHLPVKGQSHSHVGTYCAVASCGHILFEKKKKGESGSAFGHLLVLVYVLSGLLAITMILAVLLAFAAFRLHKSNGCPHVPDFQGRFPSSTTITEDPDDLHYAALRKHKLRPPRQMETTHSDCVYSDVRQ